MGIMGGDGSYGSLCISNIELKPDAFLAWEAFE